MKVSFLHRLLTVVVFSVVLAAHSVAMATEYRIVLPARYGGDADALTAAVGKVFADHVGPDDVLIVQDGTANKRIAKIAVPDDERYTVAKRKMRKFSGEIGRIATFLEALSSGNSDADRLDILSVLQGVGDDRIGMGGDIHVLVIGSPVQATSDPSWSMIGEDGTLQVPTDAALVSMEQRTPYSTAGRENALAGVYVHMCGGGVRLSRLDDMSLRHVWAQWTAAQGGVLATWTDDLAVCFERFVNTVTEPVSMIVPDISLPPAMMRPVWNEAERGEEARRPQPKSFNVFFNAAHPNVKGLIVYTGVEYDPKRYPALFDHAWCYLNSAAGKDGVQVRIDIGRKQFGNDPVWHDATDRELKAAGLSRNDAVAARDVCQFPGTGG
jgi:hypothetical protein